MWKLENYIDQMERYYERAKNLETYCKKKGKNLTIANGAFNSFCHSIDYNEELNVISIYGDDNGRKSLFFEIDLEMIQEKKLYFQCDRKYFALELGVKLF